MTVHYATQGFIFKKKDLGDSDRVYSLFTRDFGRVDVFAKSIRKIASKLGGGVNTFSFSEVEFVQGQNRKTLIDASVFCRFQDIARSPEKMNVALRVATLLDIFVKGQESDSHIWQLLADFFEKLDKCTLDQRHVAQAYYYFFWNFVSALGHGPQLYQCAHCNRPINAQQLYFSYAAGGTVCGACSKGAVPINQDVVKVLRVMVKSEWETLLKLTMPQYSAELLAAISSNYAHYLEETYT